MEKLYLVDLALILVSTKLMGIAFRRFHLPQVAGALLAGLLLGPSVLGILSETAFVNEIASLGVIVLMFCAGLETDLEQMKKSGKAAFFIALLGVIVPLMGGYWVAKTFHSPDSLSLSLENGVPYFVQNIFVGIVLTATSVSITVETLREMGRLNTKAGNTILGAAVIDDVLGIIALTLVNSMIDTSISAKSVILRIGAYFLFSLLVGIFLNFLFRNWMQRETRMLRRFSIMAFAVALMMAYVSEEVFGIADITGAYIAGIIFCNTAKTRQIEESFDSFSYLLLSPVFFASIGLKTELPPISHKFLFISVILVATAVLTKAAGCSLGARICGYSMRESLQVGAGMVSRGEVALIIADKGASLGMLPPELMGPVLVVVVTTTILTPILLKAAYFRFPGSSVGG